MNIDEIRRAREYASEEIECLEFLLECEDCPDSVTDTLEGMLKEVPEITRCDMKVSHGTWYGIIDLKDGRDFGGIGKTPTEAARNAIEKLRG